MEDSGTFTHTWVLKKNVFKFKKKTGECTDVDYMKVLFSNLPKVWKNIYLIFFFKYELNLCSLALICNLVIFSQLDYFGFYYEKSFISGLSLAFSSYWPKNCQNDNFFFKPTSKKYFFFHTKKQKFM